MTVDEAVQDLTMDASSLDASSLDASSLDASSLDVSGHLRGLFRGASDELLAMLQTAEENAGLMHCDLHTMRDWLEIAGYSETLHILLLLLILAHGDGSLCIGLSEQKLARRLEELASP